MMIFTDIHTSSSAPDGGWGPADSTEAQGPAKSRALLY